MNTLEEITKICPFPIGHENIEYEQYFAGKSYLYPLSSEQVSIANVTFEPDCRNPARNALFRIKALVFQLVVPNSRMPNNLTKRLTNPQSSSYYATQHFQSPFLREKAVGKTWSGSRHGSYHD